MVAFISHIMLLIHKHRMNQYRLVGRQTDRQTDRWTDIDADRQVDRQRDSQTASQTDGQPDSQTGSSTHLHRKALTLFGTSLIASLQLRMALG